MLRRPVLCGAFAVACVFPCVAYAQETEAKFWRNVIYVQRFTLEDGEVVVEGEMTKADFRFCFGLRAPVVQHPVGP